MTDTERERAMRLRGWLAVKGYRLAGRIYAIAARIEPPSAKCPECQCELEGDECRVCAHQEEMQRIADESYQAGGEDAYRDAMREFGSAHV